MAGDFEEFSNAVAEALHTLRNYGKGSIAQRLANTWSAIEAILPQKGAPAAPPAPENAPIANGAGPEGRYSAEVALLGGVSDILANRQQDYGPNPFNNETTGKAWEAILEARWQVKCPGPVDGVAVALMMGALKLTRAATPFGFRDDNYTDMVGYAMIAHRCDPRSQQEK